MLLHDTHFSTYPASPPKRNLTEFGIVFGVSPAIATDVMCNFPLLLLITLSTHRSLTSEKHTPPHTKPKVRTVRVVGYLWYRPLQLVSCSTTLNKVLLHSLQKIAFCYVTLGERKYGALHCEATIVKTQVC
jgi:hypothetical protein